MDPNTARSRRSNCELRCENKSMHVCMMQTKAVASIIRYTRWMNRNRMPETLGNITEYNIPPREGLTWDLTERFFVQEPFQKPGENVEEVAHKQTCSTSPLSSDIKFSLRPRWLRRKAPLPSSLPLVNRSCGPALEGLEDNLKDFSSATSSSPPSHILPRRRIAEDDDDGRGCGSLIYFTYRWW